MQQHRQQVIANEASIQHIAKQAISMLHYVYQNSQQIFKDVEDCCVPHSPPSSNVVLSNKELPISSSDSENSGSERVNVRGLSHFCYQITE